MSNKRREVYQLAFYYNVSEIDYLSYLITVIYQVPLASLLSMPVECSKLNQVQSATRNLVQNSILNLAMVGFIINLKK